MDDSPVGASPGSPGAGLPALALTTNLRERYRRVRRASVGLCEGLTPEDCQLQSMPDASPAKWHLAHTTWFFETFVLAAASRDYVRVNPDYACLFNSYYNSVGAMHPRPERGLLSRPSYAEVLDYRARVDDAIERLLVAGPRPDLPGVLELGLQHEQQHQELVLTDIKHALSRSPLRPAYRPGPLAVEAAPGPIRWTPAPEELVSIGHAGDGFAFDNESPRHRVWLDRFALASRLVTNGEYQEFIRDGGYTNPMLWLADGWLAVQEQRWNRPLYWSEDLSHVYTLRGTFALDPHEPVCHISYYEADAFARWAGVRLPREAEWERLAAGAPLDGNFCESGALHPRLSIGGASVFGNVWQWTASPYVPYPGFRAAPGALGEYNGKFMCNQYVLRGGSCASSVSHLRATYRNFFPPHARWQFSGLRLAKDLS